MFKLFENLGTVSRGFPNFVRFGQYRQTLAGNVDRMAAYCRNNAFIADGDHILIRLLQSIPISYDLPVQKYYDLVKAYDYELCASVKITSPIIHGVESEKPFMLGGKNTEYPFSLHGEYSNKVQQLERDWKNIKAVTFMRHARDDLSISIPDGKVSGKEGLVVYRIDLPLLALQHRCFKLEQQRKPNGQRLSTQNFVYMYALSGAIDSLVAVATFNRLRAVQQAVTADPSKNRYVIALPDANRFVDQYIEEVGAFVAGRKFNYAELINNVKLHNGSIRDTFNLPDNTISTRQSNWLLYMAQLPVVDWLVSLDQLHEGDLNRAYNNWTRRDLSLALNDNIFRRGMSLYAQETVSKEVNDLMMKLTA